MLSPRDPNRGTSRPSGLGLRRYFAAVRDPARRTTAPRDNLANRGRIAAEHFGALLTGPLENRSRLGTRKISRAELRQVTDNAVTTFLRAFGNDL
ncbi:TetR/AcrR family transcriptional regulator C-terminal domain-containing protein [Nocardia sp. NPDC051570]|uniref:TetR/AcrR family transcriptional regulator C-terminal domain-containing protein n=1 Tax=Nocardia sp. NPDC051570 TaxID=3364324 RepID=UPI0037958779